MSAIDTELFTGMVNEIAKLKKEIEEYEAVEQFIALAYGGHMGEALKAHYREGKIVDGKWVNNKEEEEEFKPYYEVQVEDEEGNTEYSDKHFETKEEAVEYIKKNHKEDVENEEIKVNIIFNKYLEGGDIEEYEEEEEELTWQEKMKKYNKLVSACVPTTLTKDEDLVVGDIVKHSFGCRDYKLMRVDRLTEKTIWYSECWTEKHRFRDSGGDFHIYGVWGGLGRELVIGKGYKRKRHTKVLDNLGDEKWRGQRVYKYPSCGDIWIKEEESDIWR